MINVGDAPYIHDIEKKKMSRNSDPKRIQQFAEQVKKLLQEENNNQSLLKLLYYRISKSNCT
jgi:hypothetical protein